ncbi:hypothetical protein LX32DRAFT_639377 [Colletotrichum zoysiae]|uniref:DUF7872 domain-containing protein n=1 Tax=Colletotrichum zoysiae TaxID=1216348 RepID=A0AAD9M086_9PEZI|nr:hypothetical protein LX32DRAFT_639377 [Colletotrichum zoysiae]
MAIQGWNEYVNNLNAAIMYTASILGLKLGKVVDDLWPKKKDNVTPMKMTMAWINGIINAFPVTATFGKYAGMLGANVQGFNIITGGMMFPPSVGEQYVHWSQIGDQVGSLVGEYKKAIGAYAKSVLDAPIADPQWGINRMLSGGRFLARSNNFTQDDFDGWMYQSIEVNAIGLILQAQNVYVIRTFNMTGCHDSLDGVMCEAQPNGAWTQWRLHVKDADDYMPENDRAAKLYRSYGFNKERLLKGPSDCFDASDYVQLTNPWDAATERSAELDPWMLCNFNLNVCNFDASEDNHDTGDVENYVPAHTDRMCERQGIVWS